MIKIYVYSFLLSALSFVEVKPLDIKGRVGQNVKFKCSDWNTWTDVKSNVKYLCKSPCSEDKHIIIKTAFEETKRKNQIELTNSPEGLLVTFTNLQKSDFGKYYCGVERFGPDAFIEVNLQVTDAESPSPTTTPETVIVGFTPTFVVTNIHTVPSSSPDSITDLLPTSFNIHPATTTTASTLGAGSAVYLIAGFIFIITLLVVLLMLTMKKKTRVVITQQEDAREALTRAGPDGVYQSLQPFKNEVYSTLNPTERSAGPDEVYQSLHPFTKNEDQV